MKIRDLDWLSCVVDCEGTFVAYMRPAHNSLNVRIAVDNRNPRITEKCHRLMEQALQTSLPLGQYKNDSHKSPNAQPIHVVQIWKLDHVRELSKILCPYLVAKDRQAKLMYKYLSGRKRHSVRAYRNESQVEQDRQFVEEMKRLNAEYHFNPSMSSRRD